LSDSSTAQSPSACKPARQAPRESLAWQIGSPDVHAIPVLAREHGLDVVEEPTLQEWGEWTLRLATPGGYELVVEGQAGASP
jgi:hypothetical protein